MPAFGSDVPFWLDRTTDPPEPPFRGEAKADVVIVGGGFSGLWTAIQLKDSAPSIDIVMLEQAIVGYGASGRNGGIVEASITHGLGNGLRHYADEIDVLQAESARNFREFVDFVRSEGIDCDLEETGGLSIATEPYQVRELAEWAPIAAAHSEPVEFLDETAAREEINSPRILGALHRRPGHEGIVDPGALVRGLKRAAMARGVRIHESSRVTGLRRDGSGVRVIVAAGDRMGGEATAAAGAKASAGATAAATGRITAERVVVATSAYSGWLRRLQTWFVPVYDYVLVSEQLTPAQRASIGWERRQAAGDSANRFHYFRLTADDRILWGGFDAIYHRFNGVRPELDARPASFALLDEHFRAFLPQLAGLRWSHRWGGPIDTTTNFSVMFGNLMHGRVIYVLGYTGLGVAASRWAGGVVRDMLVRPQSDLLRLRFVRGKPWPIPPEPLRSIGVGVMQRELARADANEGRKGLALRLLEGLGIGFDS